jgi:hypothetical protein
VNIALWIIGIPLAVLGLLLGLYLDWAGRGAWLRDTSESHALTFCLGLFGIPLCLLLASVFGVLMGIKFFRG